MIEIKSFVFSPFAENTYVLYDETKEAIVIDPGCYEGHEKEELKNFINSKGLKLLKVVNTHCHLDHVFGNHFLKDTFKVPLFIPEGEKEVLRMAKIMSDTYGIPGFEESTPDEFIPSEGEIKFGNSSLKILFVPGHAPGHLAFYNDEQKFVLSGDVLFERSIGRTDLPGGDFDTLVKSIKEVMYQLPDETVVYNGHGNPTSIGAEKKNNPFVPA